MNYSQANKYLLSLAALPHKQYLKDPAACDWYLKRLQYFLNLVGNPETKIPHYIHVTGTSGKGSVCLMLDSILRAAGKKVGTLTSPHPSEIVERWEVNGRPMSKPEFSKLITKMKPYITGCLKTTPYDLPSVSELMTAFGLYYFAQKKVGWAIMEVGLGGRYDSTNIIPHKDVAIITNIGLDHMEVLGKTRAKIAYEKAGIVKKGAAVFTTEKYKKIIKSECHKQGAFFKISNVKYRMLNKYPILKFDYKNVFYNLPVLGEHQINNAKLCIEVAKHLKIPQMAIKKGLSTVKLPVRMEIVNRHPLIILDGAHNPDKMKTTVETINQKNKKSKKQEIKKTIEQSDGIHLLIGFSADKNISTMIKQLSVLKPTTVACTQFTNNKLREPADPKLIAKQFSVLLPKAKIKNFNDPLAAFNWSKKQQKNNELLLVTGSMFLAGQLRNYLK